MRYDTLKKEIPISDTKNAKVTNAIHVSGPTASSDRLRFLRKTCLIVSITEDLRLAVEMLVRSGPCRDIGRRI